MYTKKKGFTLRKQVAAPLEKHNINSIDTQSLQYACNKNTVVLNLIFEKLKIYSLDSVFFEAANLRWA